MLKWIGFSISSFVFITALVLGVMLYLNPPQKQKKPDAAKKRTHQVRKLKKIPAGSLSEKDSLRLVIEDFQEQLKASKQALDSLNALVATLREKTKEKEREIEKLTASLQGKADKDQKAKEMAKTLSSMKIKQIAPILNKLDDATIISIYMQTSKPARKNILMALNEERAARITEKLIN